MVTLKLKKPRATPRLGVEKHVPVRGHGTAPRPRPTLADVQARRAAEEAVSESAAAMPGRSSGPAPRAELQPSPGRSARSAPALGRDGRGTRAAPAATTGRPTNTAFGQAASPPQLPTRVTSPPRGIGTQPDGLARQNRTPVDAPRASPSVARPSHRDRGHRQGAAPLVSRDAPQPTLQHGASPRGIQRPHMGPSTPGMRLSKRMSELGVELRKQHIISFKAAV